MSTLTEAQRTTLSRAQQMGDDTKRAYLDLHVQTTAMFNAVAAAGEDPIAIAGEDLVKRIEVTWGLWNEVARALEALEEGAAALVQYEPGKWGVVPTSVLDTIGGVFLGGWQIWIGAAAAVVAVIGVWYLVDYYLEVRDAEAQARRLQADLQSRYQQWLRELCRTDPANCAKAIGAYEATFDNPPDASPAGGFGPAIAAGGTGLAIGVLIALWAFGKKK